MTVQEYTPEEETAIVAQAEEAGVTGLVPSTMEAGTLALASLSDEEFEKRLTMLKAGRVRIARIQKELLRPKVDYGIIPGTEKPTLLKPGAEKLCDFYRFAADFEQRIEYGDGEASPAIRVLTRCSLHLGSLEGPVVAVGYGEANSWEKRYRYRRGGLTCPKCGAVGSLTAQPTSRGSHWCIPDKGGCGQNVSIEDAAKAERVEHTENPDPYELANTLVKMGTKRAHIDATLRATATSGLFTQDLEDGEESLAGSRRVAGNGEAASRPSGGLQEGSSTDLDADLAGADAASGMAVGAEAAREEAEGRCPTHGKPWSQKSGSKGTFWSCGTKNGDKWCQERPSEWWAARHEVG